MAVAEEIRTGTMPAPEGTKPPERKGKTPEAESKVSPEQEERLYTQGQADALVHAAKSEAGRKVKEIEAERDTLKSQMSSNETKVADIQAERDSLQEQIEELSSTDPKKFDLIKRDKTLRDQQRKFKENEQKLVDREQKLGEREKKVSGFEREVLIETIADEYEDGDSAKLKKAVSAFDNPTEEQIRTIAEIIFTAKTETPEKPKKPSLKPDSGKSRGGSTYFTRAQIADRAFWEANRDAILEAEKDGRIRD